MQRFIKGSKKNQFADIMEKPRGDCGSLLSRGKSLGYKSGQFAALYAMINNLQSMAMEFLGILKMVESTKKKNHLPCPADPQITHRPMKIINLHPSGKMYRINHLQKSGDKNRIFAKNRDNLG